MGDDFARTTARLEQLVAQATQETDPEKAGRITAEIYRVIEERDRLRGCSRSVRKPPSDSD